MRRDSSNVDYTGSIHAYEHLWCQAAHETVGPIRKKFFSVTRPDACPALQQRSPPPTPADAPRRPHTTLQRSPTLSYAPAMITPDRQTALLLRPEEGIDGGKYRVVTLDGKQYYMIDDQGNDTYKLVECPETQADTQPPTPLVMKGHTSGVRCVVTLPSRRIATGSGDRMIRIWNTRTGHCEQVLEGHTSAVTSLATLPNDKIASGSLDETVRIWDTATGRCSQVIKGSASPINSLLFLRIGLLVSGAQNGLIRFCDTVSGECVHAEKTCSSSFNAMTVLHSGHLALATGIHIRIWNFLTDTQVCRLEGHDRWVNSLAVLPNGHLASGSCDRTIRIWDTTAGTCVRQLLGHTSSVTSLSVLPDGHLATGSVDNTVRIWDTATGECVRVLEGHTSGVTSVAALPSGQIVSASSDQTARVWDL